jgi:hypothetical protein
VAAAFDRLGEWIHRGAVEFWATRSSELAATTKNTFQADLARGDTKLPSYTHGWWELEPDEALVIELPDPGARFWGLQLASSLWHTLDYANRLTTFNHAQARSDADGVVRLVLAHRDPGVHNWLDTTGLRSGVLICRFHRATNATAPRTQVVRLPDVLDTLPHALRVDERDRRVQIAERREGVAHMLND